MASGDIIVLEEQSDGSFKEKSVSLASLAQVNSDWSSTAGVTEILNKPALAAKILGIKNIIGPGIGNQKKYLTTGIRLSDNDWKLNYSEQSQKLLELHDIKLNNQYPQIEVNIKRFNENNSLRSYTSR